MGREMSQAARVQSVRMKAIMVRAPFACCDGLDSVRRLANASSAFRNDGGAFALNRVDRAGARGQIAEPVVSAEEPAGVGDFSE